MKPAASPSLPSRHHWSPRLYLRGFGALMACVYLSQLSQISLLIGPNGLLPAGVYLDRLRDAGLDPLMDAPSLFWWTGTSDLAIHLVVCMGLASSLCLLAGRLTHLALAVHLACYLSVVTAGQRFFTFQWDNLVLEATFMSFLLPSIRSGKEANRLVIFLFRFFLFRLLFESGVAKLQGGTSSWHEWIAMDHYYETAPIPTILGWWAHQLPHGFHRFEQWMTYVAELAVPFLLFGPAMARRLAFVLSVGLQAVIVATANYGSFNYQSALLCLFILDDRDWRWTRKLVTRALPLLSMLWPHAPRTATIRRGIRRMAVMAGASVMMLAGLQSNLRFVSRGIEAMHEKIPVLPETFGSFLRSWRIVNNYHLFADVTLTRPTTEIEIQTAGDGWYPVAFRHQATRPDWRPEFLAPHHPRIPFQHWFLALGARPPISEPWFAYLLEKICLNPDRVAPVFDTLHLAPGERPRALRIHVRDYRMTTPAERSATGNYWKRTSAGTPTLVSCSFFRSEHWEKMRGK